MSTNIFSEKDVIEKIIKPLIVKLGYDVSNTDEVKEEYHIPVGRTEGVRADMVIIRNGKPSFVIDGKNPRERLDNYETQILSYGALLKVRYGVLCNGVVFRCYDISKEKIIYEKPVSVLPKFLSKTSMIRTKSGRITQDKIRQAEKTLIQIQGTKQFTSLLYKCEDLIRDNDGLTGESAFDQMSKMLFMKMWYEKKTDDGRNLFSLENITKAGGSQYVKNFLFEDVKKENPDLITDKETLDLSDDTIIQIISYFDDYSLLETDIDIKGEAFEVFLGRTLTGDLGQFFTPRTVVDFTVKMVDPKINSKSDEPYMVLDPSCGTGGFLISTFMQMCNKIEKMPKTEKKRLETRLAEKQIYGIDVNPRLARVAKMNMFLHGDGHGGIFAANGLIDDGFDFDEKFDLVITNPPFGNKDDKPTILKKFKLADGKKTQAREVLFIERSINCLGGGGHLPLYCLTVY